MASKKYLIRGVRLAILIFILFSYQRQSQVKHLTDSGATIDMEVVDKQCRQSRGGSYVDVKYQNKIYKVEYYGEKCFQAEIGSTIELYYDVENDFFYVPESPVYERYFYGAIVALLLSFIPWQKLNEKLNSNR